MTETLAWLTVGSGSAAADPGVSVGSSVLLLAVLAAVVALVALARRLRARSPWVWWPIFGAPVALWRVASTWRATCEGADLSVPARRFHRSAVVSNGGRGGRNSAVVVRGEALRLISPRRVGVRVFGCGLAVTVRMHPSQVPADWERAAEGFAHVWRVVRVKVTSDRPGFVTLTGFGFDPLRHSRPVQVRRTTGNEAGSGSGPGSDVLVVAVGVSETGAAWVVDFRARPHWLVTGATRSGKSTLTTGVMAELAGLPVALVGIDAKGGMELGAFAPRLSALATTRAEAVAVIEALGSEMRARMRACAAAGARSVWELPEESRPVPVVLVVDEIAELFLSADKQGKEEAVRCVTGLVRIGQLGAALGVHLWISGQRFGSDLGPGATLLRAQLAGRVCHRVADTETATMTLAGIAGSAVDAALGIGVDTPGVAVVGDDSGAWTLARSRQLSTAQAGQIAQANADLRVDLADVEAAVLIARERETGGGK